jgi:hypothetical protein
MGVPFFRRRALFLRSEGLFTDAERFFPEADPSSSAAERGSFGAKAAVAVECPLEAQTALPLPLSD